MSKKQSGVALVTALLYLLVLTFIAFTLLKSGLLQFKMSRHFQNSELAFQYAESALINAEGLINKNQTKGEGLDNNESSYAFERLDEENCGFWLYKVRAEAKYQQAVCRLESIVLLPIYDDVCPEVLEERRRIVWKQK